MVFGIAKKWSSENVHLYVEVVKKSRNVSQRTHKWSEWKNLMWLGSRQSNYDNLV